MRALPYRVLRLPMAMAAMWTGAVGFLLLRLRARHRRQRQRQRQEERLPRCHCGKMAVQYRDARTRKEGLVLVSVRRHLVATSVADAGEL